jgi:GNAT superfamily N-acetyltransferase
MTNRDVRVIPANEAGCEDLQAIFGERGAAAYCQCQRYKLAPKEAFSKFPVSERSARLREQTRCGRPDADTTSGLVAYLAGVPVGWCAVEPRPAYFGLRRVYRVPWEGRTEDRMDQSVWAVTCVFVRAGFRGRGIAYALARAAVEHARNRGARALEAYPMRTEIVDLVPDDLAVGAEGMFASAGMIEVTRPGKRRVVMRIDFEGP